MSILWVRKCKILNTFCPRYCRFRLTQCTTKITQKNKWVIVASSPFSPCLCASWASTFHNIPHWRACLQANLTNTEAAIGGKHSCEWFWKNMASFCCHDNSDVIVTLIIKIFHLYLIQLWWLFFQNFVDSEVVYTQTWEVLTLKNPIKPPLLNVTVWVCPFHTTKNATDWYSLRGGGNHVIGSKELQFKETEHFNFIQSSARKKGPVRLTCPMAKQGSKKFPSSKFFCWASNF